MDPFCPDGTSTNSGKNCFEDNFFCPAAGKPDLISSSEDDDADSAGSTSSSHPSTIRSGLPIFIHVLKTLSESRLELLIQ